LFLQRLAIPLRAIGEHPLTKSRKAAAIFRFATWQLKSRFLPGPRVHEWIDGSKFYVRTGATGLTQNIYMGLHEFEDMGFLLHFVRSGDLFVDVGANVGSYTILACGARGARGCAIEPVPDTFERLCSNVRLNKMDDRVKCVNAGIGSVRGTIQFTNTKDAANHALAPGEAEEETVGVEVFPLDLILADESPVAMKVDVEGYETPLLDGAQETLKKSSLQAVIMELNGSGTRYGWDETRVVEEMTGFGLKPYSYDPFERSLKALGGKNSTSGNTLFLRNEEFVMDRIKSAPKATVLGRRF